MNYRVIAVSILDGSTYDVAEFRDFADVLSHIKAITRWDIHAFCVNLTECEQPYAMAHILRTGAERAFITREKEL